MASGWANDDAVNEQINSTIEDAIARARVKFRAAKAWMNVKSAVPHPAGPWEAIPGVRLCIHCQQEKDLQKPAYTGYNRRGSRQPVTLTTTGEMHSEYNLYFAWHSVPLTLL